MKTETKATILSQMKKGDIWSLDIIKEMSIDGKPYESTDSGNFERSWEDGYFSHSIKDPKVDDLDFQEFKEVEIVKVNRKTLKFKLHTPVQLEDGQELVDYDGNRISYLEILFSIKHTA